ncbi:MAG: signal peptidase II [Spirochaetales bacterium]|nr:signal peptidase II [Spirochaetales bacterium]
MTTETKRKIMWLAAAAAVLVGDQASKLVVILAVGAGKSAAVIGDVFRLSPQVRPFVALGPPPFFQITLFILLPVAVLAFLVFLYFRDKSFRLPSRLAAAAVVGGGLSNLCDRFVRAGGVVEFLDFKSFGIFGLSRWPAFNPADLAIVAGLTAFLVVRIVRLIGKHRAAKDTPKS